MTRAVAKSSTVAFWPAIRRHGVERFADQQVALSGVFFFFASTRAIWVIERQPAVGVVRAAVPRVRSDIPVCSSARNPGNSWIIISGGWRGRSLATGNQEDQDLNGCLDKTDDKTDNLDPCVAAVHSCNPAQCINRRCICTCSVRKREIRLSTRVRQRW